MKSLKQCDSSFGRTTLIIILARPQVKSRLWLLLRSRESKRDVIYTINFLDKRAI